MCVWCVWCVCVCSVCVRAFHWHYPLSCSPCPTQQCARISIIDHDAPGYSFLNLFHDPSLKVHIPSSISRVTSIKLICPPSIKLQQYKIKHNNKNYGENMVSEWLCKGLRPNPLWMIKIHLFALQIQQHMQLFLSPTTKNLLLQVALAWTCIIL